MNIELTNSDATINENLKDLIDLILKDGLKVYVTIWKHKGKSPISYIHFVDGDKIGYAQYCNYDGLSYTSLHIPCKGSGTGFKLDENRIDQYRLAFSIPVWARHDLVESWKSWEQFTNYSMNKLSNYQELIKTGNTYYIKGTS